jgi:hypothetical protein
MPEGRPDSEEARPEQRAHHATPEDVGDVLETVQDLE